MITLNYGKKTELAVRVFLESDAFGREYFDGGDTLKECVQSVARLVKAAIQEAKSDGIARQVGIAVVPASDYCDETGYGFGIETVE